jgi:hypothetical protein
MTVNGHSKDLEIDESGVVTEVEERVAREALPTEVRTGLQAKAGKGRMTKVESITKGDRLVAYEAQVDTDGKKSEVQVSSDDLGESGTITAGDFSARNAKSSHEPVWPGCRFHFAGGEQSV